MGWERKRGKLEELNRLLRGATDTSSRSRPGAPCCRACATASLSTPTRAFRATPPRLIGIIAHPLNGPHYRPGCGRVTEGYAILQPRVSVTASSAAGLALRASLCRAHRRRSLHHGRLGRLSGPFRRRDIHRQGALRRRRLQAALAGRVPGTRSSPTTFLRGFTRTRLVTDVEFVDDYPTSYLAYARRARRWTRGDWQIWRGSFPSFRPAAACAATDCR